MKKPITFITTICLLFGMTLFSIAFDGKKPDYQLVFENENIHSFHITVSRNNWLKMWERPFKYVKCTVQFDDEVYKDVGLRFKGNSSSSVRGLKKSYKFKFDEYQKQTFYGFKKLNFSNGFKDPSLLREKLGYDLFREAGVPASRATFAKLYLTIPDEYDKEYVGLYTIVEQVDKVFLEDRFGDTQGCLFKGEGMSDLLVYRGDDPSRYERDYEAKLSKEQRDYSVLIQFIKMLNETPEDTFPSEIEKAFNVKTFLSWLAVNTLLSNLDSYAGTGHNYYLYFNTSTGKFEFIPWDLNEVFGNFQMGSAQEMMELDIYEPYAKPKLLIERILRVPQFKERYIENIKTLMDGPFQQSVMHDKIDALFDKIDADASSDPWKQFTTKDFRKSIDQHIQSRQQPRGNIIIGLKPFVVERIRSVKAQLEGKRKGFIPRPFKPPFGKDFPPDKPFIELARQLKKAEELIDTDTKQAAWVIEHVTFALKDLGKRLGGPKGEKMDKASKQLYAFHKEIAQAIQAGNLLSAQRADVIKNSLKQTREIVEKSSKADGQVGR